MITAEQITARVKEIGAQITQDYKDRSLVLVCDPGLLRFSGGLGIRSNQSRGAGTDPIDQGTQISSFRFAIGSHHGM